MDPRFRDSEDLSVLVDGDPLDTCTRLRAELRMRRTAAILTVYGEIDAYTQNRWRYILDTALTAAEESKCLVVDVDAAFFIGCRSVLDLAHCAQQGAARGIRVSAVDPVPSVLSRIITMTGLTEWLPVFTDLADPLTADPLRRRACVPTRPTARTPGS
ncbi:STAS domain-containing protein [Nocardia sp. XZ_19_231]|uniref:STAS domain-containing protein n=1 Tax=Nocardia sp. XZ_19_231 TaxID=2769252 RepID=UPI00188E5108|nr:STAS domain-containing protein [Nocardia sp. XZ_19_231]